MLFTRSLPLYDDQSKFFQKGAAKPPCQFPIQATLAARKKQRHQQQALELRPQASTRRRWPIGRLG
jgi:hypothetical protein